MSTRKERILPFSLVAAPVAFLLRPGNPPTLSILAFGLLAWGIAAARPLRFRASWAWSIGILFALAMAWRLADEHSRDPWLVGGWFFATMAALHVASWGDGARAGFLVWSAILAMAIGSAGSPAVQLSATAIEVVLVVGFLRSRVAMPGSPAKAGWPRTMGVLVLACALAVGAAWIQIKTAGRWGPSGRWGRQERMLMGFSPISRLGSFQSEYSQGAGEVAVRVFADTIPEYLQGQLHATYRQGTWIVDHHERTLANPRMVRDASVFCRDDRDPPGRPSGWMSVRSSTFGLAPLPAGIGCFAAVADSAEINAGGAIALRGASWNRGLWWYSDPYFDTTLLESDRKVPADLVERLDAAIASSHRHAEDHRAESPVRRLAAWFQAEFRYSLVVSQVPGEDPLVAFLRDRTGYCEYFATASVLMLRREGVAARYVTGYAHPERTSAKMATFRRAHAHAWVLWRDSTGRWNLFDPTPATDGLFPSTERFGWLDSWGARASWAWHEFRDGNWRDVLEAPQRITERLSGWNVPWRWLAAMAILAVSSVGLLGWRRRRHLDSVQESVWIRELSEVESRLAKQGIRREPGETIGHLIARWPSDGDAASLAFLQRYQAVRFARR